MATVTGGEYKISPELKALFEKLHAQCGEVMIRTPYIPENGTNTTTRTLPQSATNTTTRTTTIATGQEIKVFKPKANEVHGEYYRSLIPIIPTQSEMIKGLISTGICKTEEEAKKILENLDNLPGQLQQK